jgi:hypothetical protein
MSWFLNKIKVQKVVLKMRPIGCPETSVNNYQSSLRNIPGEQRSYLHREASLKSSKNTVIKILLIGPALNCVIRRRQQSTAKSKRNKLICGNKKYTRRRKKKSKLQNVKVQIKHEQRTIHCRLNAYAVIQYFKAPQFHEKSEYVISAFGIAVTRTTRRQGPERKITRSRQAAKTPV